MSDHLGPERTFDVGPSGTPPPLDSLPGVRRVGKPVAHQLRVQYFDTSGLSLLAHGIRLSRRTGSADAGWHLELPPGSGQSEHLVEPLGAEDQPVPARFVRLTRARALGRPLEPVTLIDTMRSSTVLYGKRDAVLAGFADDHVRAQSLFPVQLLQEWRQWDLALVEASPGFLEAAESVFREHGGLPSAQPSAFLRAIAGVPPHGERSADETKEQPAPSGKGPASAVLLAYLRSETAALVAMDPGVRADEPDAVHQLRVSARRMRSVLASYKALVHADAVARLRNDLRWLASAVGATRDIEAMRERLRSLLADEPPELLLGPVAQRLEEELGARYTAAREAGLEALEAERYFGLLAALEAFLDDPPLTDAAQQAAEKVVARRIRADRSRLRRAVADAGAAAGAAATAAGAAAGASLGTATGTAAEDAALHEVRKCAKRLRYAAESAAPVLGKPALRIAEEAAGIQDVLGGLQDSVVLRQLLREQAVAAFLDRANPFSLGRLHAFEQCRAERAREVFSGQWKRSGL